MNKGKGKTLHRAVLIGYVRCLVRSGLKRLVQKPSIPEIVSERRNIQFRGSNHAANRVYR
jgi:hypothetical protein